MKKIILIIFLLFTVNLYSAFENKNIFPRSISLGNAMAPLADDLSAIMFNPAGLIQLYPIEISVIPYSTVMPGTEEVDLSQGFYAASYNNEKIGAIGFLWNRYGSSSIYNENSFLLGYSKDLTLLINNLLINISGGVNLKILNYGFELDKRTVNDPVFAGGSKNTAFSMDAGILMQLRYKYRISICGYNLTKPDLGLNSPDYLYPSMNISFAHIENSLKIFGASKLNFMIGYDIGKWDSSINMGIELWTFHNIWALRLGYNNEAYSAGTGFQMIFRMASGKKIGFRIDYAFQMFSEMSEINGSHYIGLTIKMDDIFKKNAMPQGGRLD